MPFAMVIPRRPPSRLHKEAFKQGFSEFRLVVVSPPREVDVRIDGLAEGLLERLKTDVSPELRGLSSSVKILRVAMIEPDSVHMTMEGVRMAGTAVVELELRDRDEDGREIPWTIDFPFTFDLTLGHDPNIRQIHDLCVNVSSFQE